MIAASIYCYLINYQGKQKPLLPCHCAISKLKEINNKNLTCYCFDEIIQFEHFAIDNILTDEKSSGNISVYNISYKNLIISKPLRIRFDKIDGFISRVHDRTTYLILFEG